MNSKFEFETKCRRCNFLNAHLKEIIVDDKSYLIDYLLYDSIRAISHNVYVNMFHCDNCNKFTVQDFISIEEIK